MFSMICACAKEYGFMSREELSYMPQQVCCGMTSLYFVCVSVYLHTHAHLADFRVSAADPGHCPIQPEQIRPCSSKLPDSSAQKR